jgi:hypothetical protein
MNKIIIISGVVLTILAIGVVVFLVVSGRAGPLSERFADFQVGDQVPFEPVSDSPTPNQEEGNDTPPTLPIQRFTQLTTKPVAGATILNSNTVRFVEAGTGYIFDLDIRTRSETQISETTIPEARTAVFSPDGSLVAITRATENESDIVVGSLRTVGNFTNVALPQGAFAAGFATASPETVFYLLPTPAGSEAYSLNLATKATSSLFTLPLRSVRVLWGTPTYVYTIPAASVRGYAYTVRGGKTEYLIPGARALAVLPYAGGLLATRYEDDTLTTSMIDSTGDVATMPIPTLIDKCATTPALGKMVICATEPTPLRGSLPDAWYQGIQSQNDGFFRYDSENNQVTYLADPFEETGRAIDVSALGMSSDGKSAYFINRNDLSLWLFTLPTNL